MAKEIEAPVTGTTVNPSDPMGSLQNVAMGVLGVILAFIIFALGRTGFNFIADSTPDAVDNVEMF